MSGRRKHRYKPPRRYDAQFQVISHGVAEKSKKEKEGFEQEM